MVGLVFLENPENLKEIEHINQIKRDNKVENLRWCSRVNTKKCKGTSSKYQGHFETNENEYEKWCEDVIENNMRELYGF